MGLQVQRQVWKRRRGRVSQGRGEWQGEVGEGEGRCECGRGQDEEYSHHRRTKGEEWHHQWHQVDQGESAQEAEPASRVACTSKTRRVDFDSRRQRQRQQDIHLFEPLTSHNWSTHGRESKNHE